MKIGIRDNIYDIQITDRYLCSLSLEWNLRFNPIAKVLFEWKFTEFLDSFCQNIDLDFLSNTIMRFRQVIRLFWASGFLVIRRKWKEGLWWFPPPFLPPNTHYCIISHISIFACETYWVEKALLVILCCVDVQVSFHVITCDFWLSAGLWGYIEIRCW